MFCKHKWKASYTSRRLQGEKAKGNRMNAEWGITSKPRSM
ncbi:hypothetical protein SC09_Contig19orf00382 [Bacillus subtilis]|uniref:Uncharacterized protein n=1 Tax=Bacillus subtilis TaxID=1423 RepID=A0A0D1L0W2_BACIU|nr:hypothetical protein SC09_Contig19orf00382 [Bacillus subtilis]